MVIVNFGSISTGIPPRVFDSAEMTQILAGAEGIIADYSAETVDQLLIDWETGLLWTQLQGGSQSDEWYLRALLIICLRGLRGEIRPDFTWISND